MEIAVEQGRGTKANIPTFGWRQKWGTRKTFQPGKIDKSAASLYPWRLSLVGKVSLSK